MIVVPQVYRDNLSPFRSTSSAIHAVVGDLAPKGFLPHQFCLAGTPQAIANVASSINPGSPTHSQVSHLVSNLQGADMVASAGPISDVLLKDKSWLSSCV
jgi:hypothetical protein